MKLLQIAGAFFLCRTVVKDRRLNKYGFPLLFPENKEKPQPELMSMIEIPLHIVELEKENYHILIEGKFINDTSSFWIIDTGASKTVLDANLSSHYEILEADNDDDYQSAGINQGMLETSVGKMSYLRFGDLEIIDQKIALIDLKHVNEIYGKYTSYQIAGLLGGDILMYYKCAIDYSEQTIRFQEK